MIIKLSNLFFLAESAASQTAPSPCSPSPNITNTFLLIFFNFNESAIPIAIDKPCPQAPVVASMPGINFTIHPPKIESVFIKLSNSSNLKKPLSAKIAYNPMLAQPWLTIKRSLCSQLSFLISYFKI